MNRVKVKADIIEAIRNMLQMYEGINDFIANGSIQVTNPSPNRLLIDAKDDTGLYFFEVIVKETHT